VTQRTLTEELRHVWDTDWSKRASGKCLLSQAEQAISYLHITRGWTLGAELRADQVTPDRIREVTTLWYAEGLSPATITKRLNCLSRLGVNVTGCRPKKSKLGGLKWWLNPTSQSTLTLGLSGGKVLPTQGENRMMLGYVLWAVHTGLRVEESLRLTWGHIIAPVGGSWSLTVPGTKTDAAQATLPLSSEACAALRVIPRGPGSVFYDPRTCKPLAYDQLEAWWSHCRAYIGATDIPTATLKALRRNAARHLHIDLGMPIDMVRDYLRHENVETTMGYLKLVGGYQAEEMRRWVK